MKGKQHRFAIRTVRRLDLHSCKVLPSFKWILISSSSNNCNLFAHPSESHLRMHCSDYCYGRFYKTFFSSSFHDRELFDVLAASLIFIHPTGIFPFIIHTFANIRRSLHNIWADELRKLKASIKSICRLPFSNIANMNLMTSLWAPLISFNDHERSAPEV